MCRSRASGASGTLSTETGGRGADDGPVAGLRSLLEGAKIDGALEGAEAWCAEQGFESLSEVLEVGMEGELLSAMGTVKPGKLLLLKKRLKALQEAEGAGVGIGL